MFKMAIRHCLWIRLAPVALLLIATSGCALGTTRLHLSHRPLDEITNKREGSILVKRFVDNRDPEQRPYIGNKRNGFGMVLGYVALPEGEALEDMLSERFAAALRQAGYKVVVEKAGTETNEASTRYDAVLTGDIHIFWLDLYMAVWHNVEVKTTLMSRDLQEKLWEGDMKGSETNFLWLGVSGELTKVIEQALATALNQAAAEFASDEFYRTLSTKAN